MTRDKLLAAARAAVTGEREDSYGGPEDSFSTIANFWSLYLKEKELDFPEGDVNVLDPVDVALMLDLLKTARLIHSDGKHLDSWIDKAGYAACGAECAHPEAPVSSVGDINYQIESGVPLSEILSATIITPSGYSETPEKSADHAPELGMGPDSHYQLDEKSISRLKTSQANAQDRLNPIGPLQEPEWVSRQREEENPPSTSCTEGKT